MSTEFKPDITGLLTLPCSVCLKWTPHGLLDQGAFCIPCNTKRKPQPPRIASGPIILTAPKSPKPTKPRQTKDNPATPAAAAWEAMKAEHQKRERRARKSAKMKKVMADPEVKARQQAASTISNRDPENRARRVAALKIALNAPAVRAKLSVAAIEHNARPEIRAISSATAKRVLCDKTIVARAAAGRKKAREDRAAAAYIRGIKPNT